MQRGPNRQIWLGLATLVFWAIGSPLPAQDESLQRWTAERLPLGSMPPAVRDQVRFVLEHPILYSQGPTETFACNPTVYQWFLDHPDRGVAAWRKLGAKVVDITDQGNGRFGWSDGSGSAIRWDTVYQGEDLRLWLAQGQVKPSLLAAPIPFQGVVVLRHSTGENPAGRPVVRHQADLILHTDSRSALLVQRLLGSKAPRLAEQFVGQLEMFFSYLPWFIDKHPERAEELMSASPIASSPEPRKRWSILPSRRTTP
jgi:hypothetical protein